MCPADSFSSRGAFHCTPCPRNRHTPGPASDSAADCACTLRSFPGPCIATADDQGSKVLSTTVRLFIAVDSSEVADGRPGNAAFVANLTLAVSETLGVSPEHLSVLSVTKNTAFVGPGVIVMLRISPPDPQSLDVSLSAHTLAFALSDSNSSLYQTSYFAGKVSLVTSADISDEVPSKAGTDYTVVAAVVISGVAIVGIFGIACWKFTTDPDRTLVSVKDVPLALFDIVADALFLHELGQDESLQPLFVAMLVFTVLPIVVNTILLISVSLDLSRDSNFLEYFQEHKPVFVVVFILSLTNVELLTVLDSRLFNLGALTGRFGSKTRHTLNNYGLLGVLLEDVPQLIIQLVSTTKRNGWSRVTVLCVVASACGILFGFFNNLLTCLLTPSQPR